MADTTQKEYEKALQFVNKGPKAGPEASNAQKLAFYAYFKQATDGPNKTKKPGMFDLVAKAKYDAWAKLGEMSKEDAMKGYIKNLESMTPNWRELYTQHFEKQQVTTSPAAATATTQKSAFAPDILQGKVALVTGGGTGICKEITEQFMRHGADTVIVSRTFETLEKTAKELESRVPGRRCIPISADVRDYAKLSAAVAKALEIFPKIDILVNGAAGNFLALAEKLSVNAFKTVIEIDTIGTFNASKVVFEQSMKKHGGNIINLSMTLHYHGSPFQVHAGAAKAAIDAMTKHLAVEWGLNGVRVNGIAIGPIEGTEGMKRLSDPSMTAKMTAKVPLQRYGTTRDIANTCLFLVSEAASYVTGSIIVTDGGAWMTFGGFMYPNNIEMMQQMSSNKSKSAASKSKL